MVVSKRVGRISGRSNSASSSQAFAFSMTSLSLKVSELLLYKGKENARRSYENISGLLDLRKTDSDGEVSRANSSQQDHPRPRLPNLQLLRSYLLLLVLYSDPMGLQNGRQIPKPLPLPLTLPLLHPAQVLRSMGTLVPLPFNENEAVKTNRRL